VQYELRAGSDTQKAGGHGYTWVDRVEFVLGYGDSVMLYTRHSTDSTFPFYPFADSIWLDRRTLAPQRERLTYTTFTERYDIHGPHVSYWSAWRDRGLPETVDTILPGPAFLKGTAPLLLEALPDLFGRRPGLRAYVLYYHAPAGRVFRYAVQAKVLADARLLHRGRTVDTWLVSFGANERYWLSSDSLQVLQVDYADPEADRTSRWILEDP